MRTNIDKHWESLIGNIVITTAQLQPCCIKKIIKKTKITPKCVYDRIKVLEKAGIVTAKRKGFEKVINLTEKGEELHKCYISIQNMSRRGSNAN